MSARFHAHPDFVKVIPARGWFARLLGRTETIPHPDLVRIDKGVYFGHPQTVERVKAEVERYGKLIGRKVTRVG